VRRSHVGHHAPVGSGDARQRRDLARMVHPHFHNRNFMLRFQTQQLQRKAESVVEIALRFEHVELCSQRGGHRFFGCGFAGRAGNGHHPPSPLAAHMRGQGLQRIQRVFGNQQRRTQRSVGQRCHERPLDHRGHRPALKSRSYKIVPVQPVAANCKEQLSRGHGTRVN